MCVCVCVCCCLYSYICIGACRRVYVLILAGVFTYGCLCAYACIWLKGGTALHYFLQTVLAASGRQQI